jgi:hypothetical protein
MDVTLLISYPLLNLLHISCTLLHYIWSFTLNISKFNAYIYIYRERERERERERDRERESERESRQQQQQQLIKIR